MQQLSDRQDDQDESGYPFQRLMPDVSVDRAQLKIDDHVRDDWLSPCCIIVCGWLGLVGCRRHCTCLPVYCCVSMCLITSDSMLVSSSMLSVIRSPVQLRRCASALH